MTPLFLGSFPYPQNLPITAERLRYDGKTVWDIFLLQCEDRASPEDIYVLKEYIRYYINAPAFIVPAKLKQKDFQKISYEDLIYECIDVGVDPF